MKKTYKNIEYIVYWFDEIGCFNGYVKLPENHKFQQFIDKQIEVFGRRLFIGYEDMNIDVHGGLTFSRRITDNNWPQGFSIGSWIGWDYGHAGDKTKLWEDGYLWTEEEVEKGCKSVIDQLLKIKNEPAKKVYDKKGKK